MVRAKFQVTSITDHLGGSVTVKLQPVYSTDPEHENKKYWAATPSGNIDMTIKGDAADEFEVGKEYYVDFTPAE